MSSEVSDEMTQVLNTLWDTAFEDGRQYERHEVTLEISDKIRAIIQKLEDGK